MEIYHENLNIFHLKLLISMDRQNRRNLALFELLIATELPFNFLWFAIFKVKNLCTDMGCY